MTGEPQDHGLQGVPLKRARSEMEASMICGFLAGAGVRAVYFKRFGRYGDGPRQVYVGAEDLQRAQEALRELDEPAHDDRESGGPADPPAG